MHNCKKMHNCKTNLLQYQAEARMGYELLFSLAFYPIKQNCSSKVAMQILISLRALSKSQSPTKLDLYCVQGGVEQKRAAANN
jgi:hypothetical protein